MPIATIIALIPQGIKAGGELWKYIQSLKKTAEQTGEWTAAEDAAFEAKLETAVGADHWQTDRGLADRE